MATNHKANGDIVIHKGNGDIVKGDKRIIYNIKQKRWVWLLALLIILLGLVGVQVWQKKAAKNAALPLIQTEFTNNLAILGTFYQEWKRRHPQPTPAMPVTGLELEVQRRDRMQSALKHDLEFLRGTWEISPFKDNVFRNNEEVIGHKTAAYFDRSYEYLEEWNYAISSYFDFLFDKINTAKEEDKFAAEANQLFQLKRIEAKIAIVASVLATGQTMTDLEGWLLLRSLLRPFCIFLESETQPEIREELIEVQKALFAAKAQAIGGSFNPSECEQLDAVDTPASSTRVLMTTEIDTTINELSALIGEACPTFLGNDTTATIYYLERALDLFEPKHLPLKAFVLHSIGKLRLPTRYPEGLNTVVIKVTKDSPAQKAGIRIGDILYKVNDHQLTEAFQLGQIQGATASDQYNLLYISRDGRDLQIPVNGGQALGMSITPLGCFDPHAS